MQTKFNLSSPQWRNNLCKAVTYALQVLQTPSYHPISQPTHSSLPAPAAQGPHHSTADPSRPVHPSCRSACAQYALYLQCAPSLFPFLLSHLSQLAKLHSSGIRPLEIFPSGLAQSFIGIAALRFTMCYTCLCGPRKWGLCGGWWCLPPMDHPEAMTLFGRKKVEMAEWERMNAFAYFWVSK